MNDKSSEEDLESLKTCLHRLNTLPDKEGFVKYFADMCKSENNRFCNVSLNFKGIFKISLDIENNIEFIGNLKGGSSLRCIKDIPPNVDKIMKLYANKSETITPEEVKELLSAIQVNLWAIQRKKPDSGI